MEDATQANRAKAARHRDRLRALGLRSFQVSIPDTRTQEFADEAQRQGRLISADTDTAVAVTFMRDLAGWW